METSGIQRPAATSASEAHSSSGGGLSRHEEVTGARDHTLIGEQKSNFYSDATGFRTDGEVVDKHLDFPLEDDQMLKGLHPPVEDMHSIQAVLGRPTRVGTFNLVTADAAGQIKATYDVMSLLRGNAVFDLARRKLASFYGFRATAHLKLVLNPQPFQCGLFHVFFVPLSTYRTPLTYVVEQGAPAENALPFYTGCPNVTCNLSMQSEVELSVPYTGPVAYLNLTNPDADFGVFGVQNIISVRDATNAATVEVSAFMYFTEVELFGTTALGIPQGDCDLPGLGESLIKTRTGKLGKSVLDALSALGLSAPIAPPNPVRQIINPFAMPATHDSTKAAQKLAYSADQKLKNGKLGIDSADEMDLSYIASKPCYYRSVSWINTDVQDDQIVDLPVDPNAFISYIRGGTTMVSPSRLRYVANCFAFWRGTIRYKFIIAATKFHSGRLRFVYSLGGPIQSGLPEKYPFVFSQIVDIRDGLEFTIECPYFASTPWRRISHQWDPAGEFIPTTTSFGAFEDATPRLQVFVENPLKVSPSADVSVSMAIFVSGGPDIEFGAPIAPRCFPLVITPPAERLPAVAVPQGEDLEPINMVSNVPLDTSRFAPHPITVGEEIRNVRQLIKRYQLLGHVDALSERSMAILPFWQSYSDSGVSWSYDMVAYFHALFRFYRGSMRFIIGSDTTDIRSIVRFDPFLDTIGFTLDTNTPFGLQAPIANVTFTGSFFKSSLTASVPFTERVQGGAEFEVPYYSRTHKVVSQWFGAPERQEYLDGISKSSLPAGVAFINYGNASDSTSLSAYRAAGDDFCMGYLLGAPITTVNVSTV